MSQRNRKRKIYIILIVEFEQFESNGLTVVKVIHGSHQRVTGIPKLGVVSKGEPKTFGGWAKFQPSFK